MAAWFKRCSDERWLTALLRSQMPELNLPDKMPESFEEGSAMVVKLLGPVEELSPFKLGQIQKLIEETYEAQPASSLCDPSRTPCAKHRCTGT